MRMMKKSKIQYRLIGLDTSTWMIASSTSGIIDMKKN
eukprot:CAMPEP_0114408384 /NCGR_PEP_ID=MMETSP0102-20121206/22655_1 /TAXON_ID=38822 ORGANISM="Pteridomonas danica, Strain PT" /NCGR_SAMPLE_ID=MMETSP0102 /ASSEMBLY_ACC=CAM_ASM_000212 /LENGTH=36 /DNA_ID= /DNA_START= /DNA_END= /DNA_ORIENTATION=